MTKLEILNLIKEYLNDASSVYHLSLKRYNEDSIEVARSSAIYHTLKWLLDDIKEAEAGMVLHK